MKEVQHTIKLLEDILDKEGNIILSESDIVRVLQVKGYDSVTVMDMLGKIYTLPAAIKHKKIKTNLKFPKISSNLKNKMALTSAPAMVTQTNRPSDMRRTRNMLKQATTRNTAIAQSIAVNLLSTQDPVSVGKIGVASTLLSMSTTNGATANSIAKLQQLSKKILSEI